MGLEHEKICKLSEWYKNNHIPHPVITRANTVDQHEGLKEKEQPGE
jgi:hypothetical protein